MSPKKHISMRLDPSFKEALDATLEAEEKVTGRVGGVSMIFRRLGALYLREELPAPNWRAKEEEPQDEDLSLMSMDGIEAELVELEAKLWGSDDDLTPQEWKRVNRLKEQMESLTHPLMRDPISMNQHRGIVLLGRLQVMLFEKKSW
jgi:hypothetical protein